VVPAAGLFSNIGGSFGLCIGFSVITVIEIIEFIIGLCIIGRMSMKANRAVGGANIVLVKQAQ